MTFTNHWSAMQNRLMQSTIYHGHEARHASLKAKQAQQQHQQQQRQQQQQQRQYGRNEQKSVLLAMPNLYPLLETPITSFHDDASANIFTMHVESAPNRSTTFTKVSQPRPGVIPILLVATIAAAATVVLTTRCHTKQFLLTIQPLTTIGTRNGTRSILTAGRYNNRIIATTSATNQNPAIVMLPSEITTKTTFISSPSSVHMMWLSACGAMTVIVGKMRYHASNY